MQVFDARRSPVGVLRFRVEPQIEAA
jgi:hypothetical protein